MACPFTRHAPAEMLHRQHSLAEGAGWNLDEDLSEIPDDALTLTHLNAAIQLLTAPSVGNSNFCPHGSHFFSIPL